MRISPHIPRWVFRITLLVAVYHVHQSQATVTDAGPINALQDCYNRYAYVPLSDVVGETLSWFCDTRNISPQRTSRRPNIQSAGSTAYIQRLTSKLYSRTHHIRAKRQAGQPLEIQRCRRKEYRMLTDDERNRFHSALNQLYSAGNYQALAAVHGQMIANSAHGGPNFLGFHRAYIKLMEYALQEVDPSICLPYWDSSMDNELPDPSDSYVFSNDFFGGRDDIGGGEVRSGTFSGWTTQQDGPLIRNIGVDGQLFSLADIEAIIAQRNTHDIVPPNASPANSIEFHHGAVHVFVGGQMMQLETAAFDPIFFLHHCFVDYIWELFRTKQRAMGIDPQTDYPEDFGSPLHRSNNSMGLGMGFTVLDGYDDLMTEDYVYDPSPDCNRRNPDCGSRYLTCDVRRGRCIPIDPTLQPPPGPRPGPGPRPVPGPRPRPIPGTRPRPDIHPSPRPLPDILPDPRPFPRPGTHLEELEPHVHIPVPESKPCNKQIKPIQNNFCINGVCDTNQWVYVPVKVVSVRPPDFSGYQSFPVRNGNISRNADIYQPSAYSETTQYITNAQGRPKPYEKCNDGDGIGQVFVQSTGVSYEGFYKESAIIDQRLATSLSIAYVAVKDPRHGPTKALFRAFDSCGRICHTACKIPGTNDYHPCSGVLNIEDVPGQPKQYSRTYGEAALSTWGYATNENCPSFLTEDITLTFYCDYKNRIPWADAKAANTKRPIKLSAAPVAEPEPAKNPNECKIDSKCTIGIKCPNGPKCLSGEYGQTFKCLDSCNSYAVCNYGIMMSRQCPPGWAYSAKTHVCTSRERCIDKAGSAKPEPKAVPDPPPRRVVRPPTRSSYLQNLRGRFYGQRMFG